MRRVGIALAARDPYVLGRDGAARRRRAIELIAEAMAMTVAEELSIPLERGRAAVRLAVAEITAASAAEGTRA